VLNESTKVRNLVIADFFNSGAAAAVHRVSLAPEL
jgi:hypothetical protein